MCSLDAGQLPDRRGPAKQSYMQSVEMNEELIQLALDELEYLPCHYVHHFADAMAVMAYHHPNEPVRLPLIASTT